MVSRYSLIVLAAFFLFGCKSVSSSPTPAPATETPPPAPTNTVEPDYLSQVRNAPYQLGATDALKVVQLNNGTFEQGKQGDANYISVKLTDYVASGDLNKDGTNDIAAVITEYYGGSGVFTFLAAYEEAHGSLDFVNSTFLDDRPKLNSLSIDGQEIFLDMVTHSQTDPMCCPSFHHTNRYRLDINNQLYLSNYTTFTTDDKPHTITIDSPANDTVVNGLVPVKGRVAIAPFENNLSFHIYDLGGVELASGAVPVSTNETGGAGTFDTSVPLGNIIANTTIRIEVQDTNAADGSMLGMDSVELVVK